MDKAQAKERILKAMRNGGNFCNNIVGAVLREYANATSNDIADELIIEMKLGKLLGIQTEKEARVERALKRG